MIGKPDSRLVIAEMKTPLCKDMEGAFHMAINGLIVSDVPPCEFEPGESRIHELSDVDVICFLRVENELKAVRVRVEKVLMKDWGDGSDNGLIYQPGHILHGFAVNKWAEKFFLGRPFRADSPSSIEVSAVENIEPHYPGFLPDLESVVTEEVNVTIWKGYCSRVAKRRLKVKDEVELSIAASISALFCRLGRRLRGLVRP